MKRRALYFIISVLLLLSGCSAGEGVADTTEITVEKTADSRFIFVCPIIENEYWEKCIEGIRQADAELGTTTMVIGPKTADNFSTEIVEYMKEAVEEKPDGIMAYAGIEGMFDLIDQADGQGIPVLALDSDAPSTARVAYVGTDAYNAGYEAGKEMVNLTDGKAKLGVMVSSLSAEKEMQVLNAFLDAVHDYDIEVVATAETDADPDVAEQKADAMLTEHPEITAMFNTAGYNVTGAARVKKARGMDDLVLMGFDDVEENLQFVREGVINAIFVQQIEQVGYQSVYLMKECVDKGYLPRDSYDTGTILVTQENVENYDLSEQTVEKQAKTVRVGYYTGDTAFQDGYEDGERKSGYAYEYYQAIATLTGWEYEYVYGSREEMLQALMAGTVDIVAGIYQTDIRTEQVCFAGQDMGLSGEERYFVVNKNRTDLLEDLDYAMEQLAESSPDFTVTLWQKYYNRETQQVLSGREREWLDDKGVLKIGYVRHNLPFSDQDEDGQPTGLVKDLMKNLSEYLHVEMEPVCYEYISDLEDGLTAGEIDIAFPIYSDLWLSETKQFRQTDAFINDRVMIVYSGSDTSGLMDRVAISKTGVGQRNYMAAYYPDSELVFYDTREEIMEAIKRGDERCIIGCSSILQRFLGEHPEYENISIAYLDTSENFGMAVHYDNGILAGILNKAIRQLDPAVITSDMIQYSGVEPSYTISDFIRRHAVQVITFLSLFFVILVCVFGSYWHKSRIFNIEQEESRKALEEALEAARVASEAKTTFLSSMSHDIRTPMNAIVGMTSIASKHLDDQVRVKDCLDKIDLSSRHLLTLINDVLDISKIESGKLVLNPVAFSIRDTVTTLVNIVCPQVRAKNLAFEVHIHGMDYETLYADEVRINQIYVNLLSNAIKYTPEGGQVVMDLSEELLADGETVRLIYGIEDTGIGMSEEFMENMYDTFSRAKDSRINTIQGTGLGLSIVKQMVDLFGGTLECQSIEGKGTVFTVTLDVAVGEKETVKPELPDVNILLIDDDEIFLESAGEVLSDMGVAVDLAASGEAAVKMVEDKLAEGKAYSVVIVDWKMPGMDGLDTIKAIHEQMGENVPIILVSAYDWSDIEDEAKDSGASGFINKPLFPSYIYEKLRKALHLDEEDLNEEESSNEDLKGLHLLIAEDNDLNWEVIAELLGMCGITADWAENGKVCVEMLTAAEPGTYDLVLMDIQMPVMNGREAAKAIRADERDYVNNIPIIAMTADAFAEDIAACMEAGMNGHASKPIDMSKLFQEMRKAIADHS